MKISATIITFNEQKNIARAVKSLDFADEIIVIDSGSTDRTVTIATQAGAKVIQNPFIGYGQQKNFAAESAQNDWILNIDADEEIDQELKNSILQLQPKEVIYFINRRTNFCGKWIYHGGWYPDIIGRLYHRKQVRWSEPHIHEELIAKEKINKKIILPGHLNHYSFPTIESQITTNIKYARLGAKELLARKKRKPAICAVFLRPIGKFLECFLIKRGFLDGLAGLIIAINAGYSMFMKYIFAREIND